MAEEARHGYDMGFCQSTYVATKAFDIRRAEPVRDERVKRTRLGAEGFRQVPPFEAILLGKTHWIVQGRQGLFSDSAGPDGVAVVDGPPWVLGFLASGPVSGIRGEVVAAQEHQNPRGSGIHR